MLVYSGLARAENLLSAHLVLPVHARYHAPSDNGGYWPVTFGAPELFLRCAGTFDCPTAKMEKLPCYACSDEQCSWMRLPFKTVSVSLIHFTTLTSVALTGMVIQGFEGEYLSLIFNDKSVKFFFNYCQWFTSIIYTPE